MIELNTKYLEVIELAVHIMDNYKLYNLIHEEQVDYLQQTLLPYIKFASAELELQSANFSI